MTTFAVAQNVSGVVTTSCPSPTREASSDRWSAAVHEFTATASLAPVYSANARSKLATRGPVDSQPDSSASTTSAISSAPIAGGANGTTTSWVAIALAAAVAVDDGIRDMGNPVPLCNGDTTTAASCQGCMGRQSG